MIQYIPYWIWSEMPSINDTLNKMVCARWDKCGEKYLTLYSGMACNRKGPWPAAKTGNHSHGPNDAEMKIKNNIRNMAHNASEEWMWSWTTITVPTCSPCTGLNTTFFRWTEEKMLPFFPFLLVFFETIFRVFLLILTLLKSPKLEQSDYNFF